MRQKGVDLNLLEVQLKVIIHTRRGHHDQYKVTWISKYVLFIQKNNIFQEKPFLQKQKRLRKLTSA